MNRFLSAIARLGKSQGNRSGNCLAAPAWISLLSILLLSLSSCLSNEFEIKAELDGAASGSYRILWHASSDKQSFVAETVLSVVGGKGSMKCPTRYPSVVFIFQGSTSRPAALFWAERGDDISITGPDANPASWTIKGNKITESLTEWRLANKDALQLGESGRINDAVAKFVKTNKDSEVSTILLLCYFDRRKDETHFLSLWNSLSDDARNPAIITSVGRADLLDGTALKPAPLSELIFHAPKGRKDTLRPKKARASILYFSSTDGYKQEDFDTLRALTKQFNDSSKRIVANIFLDPDSLAWERDMMRDSIPGLARLWQPTFISDSEAAKIGVYGPEFFIVSDGRGVQKYRGQSARDAAAQFRKLMK